MHMRPGQPKGAKGHRLGRDQVSACTCTVPRAIGQQTSHVINLSTFSWHMEISIVLEKRFPATTNIQRKFMKCRKSKLKLMENNKMNAGRRETRRESGICCRGARELWLGGTVKFIAAINCNCSHHSEFLL